MNRENSLLGEDDQCEWCSWDGKEVYATRWVGMDATPLCEAHAEQAERNIEAAVRDMKDDDSWV